MFQRGSDAWPAAIHHLGIRSRSEVVHLKAWSGVHIPDIGMGTPSFEGYRDADPVRIASCYGSRSRIRNMRAGSPCWIKGDLREERRSEDGLHSRVDELRRRARRHIENGAVTEDYKGNGKTVIRLLNEALATELVCVFATSTTRPWPWASTATVAAEFARRRRGAGHADLIAARITQLGGDPDY